MVLMYSCRQSDEEKSPVKFSGNSEMEVSLAHSWRLVCHYARFLGKNLIGWKLEYDDLNSITAIDEMISDASLTKGFSNYALRKNLDSDFEMFKQLKG